MNKLSKPEIKFTAFNCTDIITTSGGDDGVIKNGNVDNSMDYVLTTLGNLFNIIKSK